MMRFVFLSAALILIFSAYFLFKKKLKIFLNELIPKYHSVNIRSNDPYLKSIFDEEKVEKDIDGIKKTILKFIFIIFLIISFSLVFSLLFSDSVSIGEAEGSYDEIQFGPFGDLFNGILAPLLTFSSFVFLLLTVIMQNIQMRATLNELQLSRIEMISSTRALELQARNIELQKFDNIFFSLIENYKNLIKELREEDIHDDGKIINERYDIYVSKKLRKIDIKANEKDFLKFWNESKDYFISVFLMNYQILKYIKENVDVVLSSREAKRYIGILRAVTPKEIIFLIYVNCGLGDFEKYRNLIERFSLFEHIHFNKLDIKKFKLISYQYNISAFGDCERLKKYLHAKHIEFLLPHPSFDGVKHFIENIKEGPIKNDRNKLRNIIDFANNEINNFRTFYSIEILGGRSNLISKVTSDNENFKNFCKNIFYISQDKEKKINEYADKVKNNISLECKKNYL